MNVWCCWMTNENTSCRFIDRFQVNRLSDHTNEWKGKNRFQQDNCRKDETRFLIIFLLIWSFSIECKKRKSCFKRSSGEFELNEFISNEINRIFIIKLMNIEREEKQTVVNAYWVQLRIKIIVLSQWKQRNRFSMNY